MFRLQKRFLALLSGYIRPPAAAASVTPTVAGVATTATSPETGDCTKPTFPGNCKHCFVVQQTGR